MDTMTLVLCTRAKPLPPMPKDSGLGRDCVVLTETGHAQRYPDMAAVRVVPDFSDLHACQLAVADLLKEHRIRGIWAPYERSLLAAGYLRTTLQLPGDGYETAVRFANKAAMKRRLRDAGIPVAPFLVVHRAGELREAAHALGWPAVVKPAIGGGGHGVTLVRDEGDIERFCERDAVTRGSAWPWVVEALVPMRSEYHVDGVVHDGVVRFAAVARYFKPLLDFSDAVQGTGFDREMIGSYWLPADNPMHQRLSEMHERVVAALGLRNGVTHLEAYGTSGGNLVAGEITCRPGGTGIPHGVWLQHGVDLWAAAYALSRGEEPEVATTQAEGVVGRCNIPLRPGRIVALGDPDELARTVEGILDVRITAREGDRIPADLDAAAAAAVVFFRAPDIDAVAALARRVVANFPVMIEPTTGTR